MTLRPPAQAVVVAHNSRRPPQLECALPAHSVDASGFSVRVRCGEADRGARPRAWTDASGWSQETEPAQRLMAERAGATIKEVRASHVSPISRPSKVAELMEAAVAATSQG
jgi:hypothetical protein